MTLQSAPEIFPAALVGLLSDLSCVLFRRRMDANGTISYDWLSPNVTALFGMPPECFTVNSQGALNALHWADRDDHVREIRRSAAHASPARELFRLISTSGKTHWLRGSAHPRILSDGSVCWDGAWMDITQWMRAEYHFQTVMDHAEDCILTVDCTNGIEWANAATEKLFGYDEGTLRGQCLIALLDADCPVGQPSCRGDEALVCFVRGTQEVTARRANGTRFPFEMTVSEVRSDGQLSLIVIGRDITVRKHTEMALADAERRLRQIYETAPIGIIVTDWDGCIRQSNPAFHAMCGLPADQIDGASLFGFIDPSALWSLESTPDREFHRELPFVTASGDQRRWQLTGAHFAAPEDDRRPALLLLLLQDITDYVRAADERRQLERVLTEGQKLEALGRLAGGVAHELNNMLGPILMGAQMLTRSAELNDKNHERCLRIIEAAKHGRDIVRGVLAYCRQERQDLAALDLVLVLRQFGDLVRPILPPDIQLSLDVAPAQVMIMGNSGQITQILLNMANNGRDAINGKGRLSIGLHLADDASAQVLLTIADTGCGMNPDIARRIFDPFFTTKPVGQGTGLGLSVVHGLITAMGGSITVDSQEGQGTTFTIALPIADMACPSP